MQGKDALKMAKAAKKAAGTLSAIGSARKDNTLREMARALLDGKKSIISANAQDLRGAKSAKLKSALIDRLTLNDKHIKAMADSLEAVATLPDPVGDIREMRRRPNGLLIGKMRVPIGVITIIYESRPNVTSDCIGLCLKSGNSVILKGGSESINSNKAIFAVIEGVLKKNAIPLDSINLITTADRKAVSDMLKLNGYIDLVIPRGGEGLIRTVAKMSRIPVIKHYKGICHVYVDEYADLNMAQKIAYNAKVQRPGVCNAMETLLVHEDIAARFLPVIAGAYRKAGVELRGCKLTRRILKNIKPATEKDWRTEYLDLILSVRVVDSIDAAIGHINTYGSRHSDAIVTDNYDNAMRFLAAVDSASVYVNASTRFTDGYEFGLGAEIGISTDKIHARGPMGLEELTTYKYVVFGSGQVRE